MKNLINLILLSLIFSFSFSLAGAESFEDSAKVISRGYGSNYDEQLLNAKIAALSNVIGSFIVGDTIFNSEKDKVIQNIKEYHGGYIESYNITTIGSDYVEIEAIVKITKDNQVYVPENNEIDIEDELNNYKNKREIIDYLDNPMHAFVVKVAGIDIKPEPYTMLFKINAQVMWQPKWTSDLETFVTEFTGEGKTSQNINVNMIGRGIYRPHIDLLQVLFETKPKQSEEKMICFAKDAGDDIDACRNLAGGFMNMPPYSEMPMYVKAYDNEGEQLFSNMVMVKSTDLYESVSRNQTKKYFLTKRTFDQPAYIVYKNGIQNLSVTVNAEYGIAEKIKTIRIEAAK